MSEHQYVAFRAIDKPVTEENLEFMEKQSSRASITPWEFENEYHYGDFHGDKLEMLRRGYDFHLHYANFGTRDLFYRLPHGLPDAEAAKPYFAADTLKVIKDKQGPGIILALEPYFESGELGEIWVSAKLINNLALLRAEILAARGDFEAAYGAHREFHAAVERQRSQRLESAARARHALFETAEARREAERFRAQARLDPLTGLVDCARPDSELGWGPVALGGLDVFEVPGGHETLIEEPYVRALATRFQEAIDRARRA